MAVHALVLYGVLERGVHPARAVLLRQRAVGAHGGSRRDSFRWLEPPSFAGVLTVADIVAAPTPAARAEVAGRYVREVWSAWARAHLATIAGWYAELVAGHGPSR